MLKQILLSALLLSVFLKDLKAQQIDSMQTMQEFLNVCTTYKQQIPLHVSIGYSSTANIISNIEDSTKLNAEFFLLSKSAYMRFGEIEEIVNDSIALLVSQKMKRMMLYNNAQPVITQMNTAMGLGVPGSSIEKWCKKFKIFKNNKKEKETIELHDRGMIYGTALPKETIEIAYNSSDKIPAEVVNIKRSIIPIDKTEYDQYFKDPLLTDKLLILDSAYYVIKEQKTVFQYKQVDHNQSITLPFNIADRVTKLTLLNKDKFVPNKGFEEYTLTEE